MPTGVGALVVPAVIVTVATPVPPEKPLGFRLHCRGCRGGVSTGLTEHCSAKLSAKPYKGVAVTVIVCGKNGSRPAQLELAHPLTYHWVTVTAVVGEATNKKSSTVCTSEGSLSV